MLLYCSSCRKHMENLSPKKIKMTNELIRQASKFDLCVTNKSTFPKQKSIGAKPLFL